MNHPAGIQQILEAPAGFREFAAPFIPQLGKTEGKELRGEKGFENGLKTHGKSHKKGKKCCSKWTWETGKPIPRSLSLFRKSGSRVSPFQWFCTRIFSPQIPVQIPAPAESIPGLNPSFHSRPHPLPRFFLPYGHCLL